MRITRFAKNHYLIEADKSELRTLREALVGARIAATDRVGFSNATWTATHQQTVNAIDSMLEAFVGTEGA